MAHDWGLLKNFTLVLEKANFCSLRPFKLAVLLKGGVIQGFGPDLNMVEAASFKRDNLAAARPYTHVEVKLFIINLLVAAVQKLNLNWNLQVICHLHR